MKTISRYIMTLALLIAAVGGAWATDVYVVGNGDGNWLNNVAWDPGAAGNKMTEQNGVYSITFTNVDANSDLVFKFAINGSWNENFGCTSWDANELNKTLSNIEALGNNIMFGLTEKADVTISFNLSELTYMISTKGMKVGDDAEPDVDVTINDTKTEASFEMPQYDVTATYTIKRDMTVDMTATMGDGTDGVRYRVKKDGNNKFIPADMEMAAVPALFTVNDAIEQKALTQTQDYIVQIYAIDAEGQPTGDPMTFATFTFEPGIYAVKAVAADGSDYAGETALSNTFKLFQGYEVQVAAKEFITYYKDEPLYADTETSADAELYTISSVNDTQATLSAAIETAPRLTPLLIFNNSDQAKTFLLIPAEAEPNLALTVAPEFQGTLTGTTIAASTEGQTNYAFNGKAFVFVKNAIEVGPNKAWLSINTGVPSARITIVFDDATKIANTNLTNITNGDWYDLNGRKLNGMPTKKGVYIMNGRKVVVK